MREPDTCLLQLLANDQRVRLHIGSMADASFARVLRLYCLGNIGQSSWEHSSQPCASRAASREWPCSIADLIRRQRSQSGLSVIAAAPCCYPPDRQPIGSAGADRLFLYVISCRQSGLAHRRAGGRCQLSRLGFQAHLNKTKARPRSRNRDGPLTCRYIRGQVDRSKTNGETLGSTWIRTCWKRQGA